jgi:hypothetical protein
MMPPTHNRTGRDRKRRGVNMASDAEITTTRSLGKKGSAAFTMRPVEMQESPAFRVLSLTAHRILARIEIELRRHAGKNNGRLAVTFDDFVEYGIDRHAIAPGIREVEALGFVEITEHGRAGNETFRRPNLFRLTYQPSAREPGSTHEWRSIKTMEKAVATARAARRTRRKQKSSVGIPIIASEGSPHRKARAPSVENPHYSHGGESPTTLDISRGGRSGGGGGRIVSTAMLGVHRDWMLGVHRD